MGIEHRVDRRPPPPPCHRGRNSQTATRTTKYSHSVTEARSTNAQLDSGVSLFFNQIYFLLPNNT